MADDIAAAGAQPAEEPNPFADRLKADPSLGEPSLAERARLSAVSSFARGTLFGAGGIAALKRDAESGSAETPQPYTDEFGSTIAPAATAPISAKRLEEIQTDLARYETLRSAEGPLENIVAAGTHLGPGLLSPEGWVTSIPGAGAIAAKVPGLLGRMLSSGASQAAVQGAVNPAVQGIENLSGIRQGYDPAEHLMAVGGGAVLGAGLHGAMEGLGAAAKAGVGAVKGAKGKLDAWSDETIMRAAAAKRQAEADNMRALQEEDPSMRPGGADHGPAQPMPDAVVEGDTASVTLPEQAVTAEAPAMDPAAVVADPEAAAAKAAAEVPRTPEVAPEEAPRAAAEQSPSEPAPAAGEAPAQAETHEARAARFKSEREQIQDAGADQTAEGRDLSDALQNATSPKNLDQAWAERHLDDAIKAKRPDVADHIVEEAERRAAAFEADAATKAEAQAAKPSPSRELAAREARAEAEYARTLADSVRAKREAHGLLDQARPVLDQVHPDIAPAIEQALAPQAPEPNATNATAPEAKPLSKAEKARAKAQQRASDIERYFMPGELVPSYGGGQDRVVSYTPDAGGGFTVKVHAVDAAGKKTGRVRTHSTEPLPRELKAVLKTRPEPEPPRPAPTADPAGRLEQWKAENPLKTVAQVMARAEENKATLESAIAAVNKATGADGHIGPNKLEATVHEKMERKAYPDAGHLTDVVRGGFKTKTPEQADAVIAGLAKQFDVIDEGWVVTPVGYADRKALVRFKDGSIGEIQIWEPTLLEAKKNGGHELYTKERSLPKGPEKTALQQQMVAHYEAAAASLDPSWKAIFGKGGTSENLALHASSETTRAELPTSELSASDHLPPEKTQASPGDQTAGAPSNTQNFIGGASASDVRPVNLDSKGNPLIGAAVPGIPEHKVSTAAGRTIEVAPVVVEARDLVTSADGGFDQAVQPRQRDRAASQAQIRDIATQLDPERLGYSAEADRGAPIVGDDRMVESGNGRVLALRRVYEQGGEAADRYRAWLEAQGVDLAGFSEPVLVRQRMTPLSPEERGSFGMEANQAATLSMSAAERGLADARLISPEMLDLIRNPDDLRALANLDFRKAFVRALPATEHGAMVTGGGEISSEGMTRIRNAILARAYDNSGVLARIAEATDDDAKSLTNALVSVAPDWAKLRADIAGGLVRSDTDLTPALLEAVTRTTDLRAKGQKLDTFLSQQDAFDRLDETVEAFMRMFYDAKGRRAAGAPVMAERLRAYASQARKVSANGGLDLGLTPVTTRELMALAARKGAKNANEGQTGLQFRRAGDGAADNTGADGVQFRRGAGDGSGDAVDAGGGSGARGEGRDAGGSGAGGDGAGAGDPSPAQLEPLHSLQQQAQELADVLNVPLRGGRTQGGRAVLGQFDQSQDVVRVRNVADFETVAHEGGHALEKHMGAPLSDLIRRHELELGRLDYEPTRMDPREGFAEWFRHALVNPAMALREAPSFAAAFRNFMQAADPELAAALDQAIATHQRYLAAPTGQKLEAMVRKPEDETVLRTIREEGLPTTVGLYLAKAYEAIFDDKAPAARAVRSMLRAMQPHLPQGERIRLEGADNPENLVRLFARSQQAAVQDMREGVRPYRGIAPDGPSLRDALITATGEPGILGRWNGPAVEAFDRYMVLRRAELLYRRFQAGEMERRPIALSHEEVRAELARLEAESPNFRAGSDQVHEFTRQLLRKQYESGLIDQELYGRLMGEEFYVPLFRHMDDKPNAGSGAGGQDGPGNVQLIKRIGGSDRDIIPPTQSLMTQAFLVNRTVAHNDIIKSFVSLARQARGMGAEGIGRILEEIPAKQMMGKRFDLQEAVASAARAAGVAKDDLEVLTGSLTDVFGDDPIMATIFRAEPTGKRGEPIVFYKDGGQLKAVRLQSKDEGLALYETLASLPPVARDLALQFGAVTSSALRTGIVTNPVFAVSNFIRDQLAVGVLRSDYLPFVHGARGVLHETGLLQDSQNWGALYSYAGGVSPGAGSAGLSELIDRDINALARRGWLTQKVGSIADLQQGHLLGPLKAVAETVETAESGTRLSVMKSVFEQKKRQGLSDYDALIEAAAQATDLMDFGRHGSGTLYLRSLVPFFNAHLQGLDKARRTLIEPLWRAARGDVITEGDAAALRNAQAGLFKMIGVGGALGVGYGLWASQYEAYRDASPELKATHLIIPGEAFGRPGKVLVIPKPFELAMGVNVGEAIGLGMSTGDPRAFHQAVEGMREVIQPPNPLTGIPLLKTGFELALNRSLFTGRDIVPENLQNRENPRFEVKPNTSSLAKAIGDKLNISPIKVDYAVGSMFGNWGRDLMAVSNVADPDNPAQSAEDTTFLRRFIKGADRVSETSKKFWDNAGQRNGAFAQAAARYKSMTDSFQDREAADYLGSLPAAQRAYVTLTQGGDEQGKSAFKPEDKRINPVIRSAAAVQILTGYIRELGANTQRTAEDNNRVAMNPTQRREVIDSLRQLAAIEQRNALVLSEEKGYAGRPLLSAEDQFEVLKAKSPEAAAEVAKRYAGKQIVPTDLVAQLWPEAQKRLLADGTQAEIHELGLVAKGDYAFGGEKVKLQPKRKAPILPGFVPTNPKAPDLSPGANRPGPTTTRVPNPLAPDQSADASPQ